MSTKEENDGQWNCSFRDKLLLSRDKFDYVLLTKGEYSDDDGLDNGDTNPYWVGSFYSVNGDQGFRMWRNDGDPNSTLLSRFEEEDQRVSPPKNQWFFNCIHFDIYQKREVYDKKGNIVIQKRGDNAGNPYKAFQPVTSIKDRKRLSRNPDENTVFFRKKYLQVGSAHYDNLLTIIDKAKSRCRCTGNLEPVGYVCSNCEASLLDMEDSDLTLEDVNRFGDSKKRCKHCGVTAFPEAVYECDTCDDPIPLAFNEVVAKVKKDGVGPKTIIQVDSIIPLSEFSMDNKQGIVESDKDGNAVIENDEFVLIEELEEPTTMQWNFEKSHPAPENSEVSAFLRLQEGDPGYEASARGYSKRKPIKRRRFR